MEQDELSEFLITKENKKLLPEQEVKSHEPEESIKREPLTTKNAVNFLLAGTLRQKVCRYCLNVATPLYELDRVYQIGTETILYKVTVRDMIASFHPFKVIDEPNFPNRICDKCLNRTFSAYLFTQQCDQSERALRNCFDDIYEKLDKLDPLERPKKRGRQKINPNYNVIYSEHEKVFNYADPLINIINIGTSVDNTSNGYNELQCPRCWQILPNLDSLLNHEKLHPKFMWYNCHICGKSFAKRYQLKRHVRSSHELGKKLSLPDSGFKCTDCGVGSVSYDQHLRHIEKHKFQTVMEHLVHRNMDKLCALCLNKDGHLVELDKTISLHGGHPELTGHKSIYNIVGSTLPEMNILNNYTGSKICEKCLNNAITAYIFLSQTYSIRNRLSICIDSMLSSLKQIVNPEAKLFIEIAQNTIMAPKSPDYIDEDLFIDDDDEEFDEEKLKVEVLEDEFRIKSASDDSDDEERTNIKKISNDVLKDENNCKGTIVKPKESECVDKDLLKDNNQKLDEQSLEEVLEDKFRKKSEPDGDESRIDIKQVCNNLLKGENNDVNNKNISNPELIHMDHVKMDSTSEEYDFKTHVKSPVCDKDNINIDDNSEDIIDNPAKRATKTYVKKRFINGYQSTFASNETEQTMNDVCSEFLTFKKKKKPVRKFYSCKFTCPLCCKHFLSEHFLTRHILKHVNKKVKCTICLKDFQSKFYLYEHTKIVHLLDVKNSWACKVCGRTFISKNKFIKHKRTHRNKECQLCDKLFSTQRQYDSHMQRHTAKLREIKENNIQTCSFCEKECSNDNSLSVHVNKVHLQIKPYSCDMCNRQFYTETNLNCHQKVHSLFSIETCQVCNRVLKSRKSLVIHVRKHIGAKPHSCQICRQSFYSQNKLTAHMRVLHGGKYCCKQCKTVFINKSDLRDHVSKTHNMI
ncbi:zinc finger protein 62-like isoform X2 [Achroia grisella]|uniref:zinc finger protein 62-like isoform X2 n=1 Tax=Achroia grisella TaxID=688607 RepID=UPI0027D23BC0|nr:zinc finger protein 62-like isoform X2 [Achroia grisella]